MFVIFFKLVLISICSKYISAKKSRHVSSSESVNSVALIFWGLCRSTDVIAQSYQDKILTPLKKANITYDVFAHTYSIDHKYVNKRSHEKGIYLNTSLVFLLHPTVVLIEDQDVFDRINNLEAYHSQADPWHNKYATVDNLVRGLHSLNEATKLWETMKTKVNYDRVIFLRPDVEYFDALDVSWLTTMTKSQVILPNFANYPVNDRFAICHPEHASAIGRRYENALAYSKQFKLHSETFLSQILKKSNLKVSKVMFRFARIRGSGEVDQRDLKQFPFLSNETWHLGNRSSHVQ